MKKRSIWLAVTWYALCLAVFVVSLHHGHFANPRRRWDQWDDEWEAWYD